MPSRHRRFVFTWNNYDQVAIDYLDSLQIRYLCYGKEVAPGTGTPHLQGFLCWRNAKTEGATRELLRGCHVEIARGSALQASDYCKKGGDYVERGDLPSDPIEQGRREAERWDLAWDSAKAGAIEEIPADIRVRCYSTLKRIAQDYMPRIEPIGGVCGLWLFGKSGAGKTLSVSRQYPDAFPKPRNIWWDGYQEEEVVTVDDVDKYDVALGGKLKHWADFAPFIAEIKGGSRKIRPRLVIVTSQYRIEDIWQDAETREALNRRFKFLEKLEGQDVVLEL